MPPTNHSPSSTPPRRVIIIGAGVAGLSCAHELLKSSTPLQVIVLEARNRIGGRVLTHWLDADAPDSHLIPNYGPNALNIQPNSPTQNSQTTSTQPQNSNQNIQQSSQTPRAVPILPATLLNSDGSRSSLIKDQSHPTSPFPNTPFTSNKPRRHIFADLASGKTIPQRQSSDGTSRLAVDIGASVLHGCSDEYQLVFKRAIHAGIRAPIVAGNAFYESTEHAIWFDDTSGKQIPTETIVEIHNIFYMASRYMAAVASASDEINADMKSVFNAGIEFVCEQLDNRVLTDLELAILKKICARSVGYCLPMSKMAIMQASAGMEATSADAHIGFLYEEDDPPFPGEIPSMAPGTIRQHASRLQKNIIATQKSHKNMIASRRGGGGDRIVLDGYTPFLIDILAKDVDIRLNQSVCGISKALRAPDSQQDPVPLDEAGRPMRTRNQNKLATQTATRWQVDPDTSTRTVVVSTRNGEVYQCDFVVVTLPIGVLKEEHEQSGVTFFPPLSEEKHDAIQRMGMGVHNKILLRFHDDEVFWPPKVPQINCVDPRFQFFNLHSYGKTGVLLVHVFAESGFGKGYWGLSDEGIVSEVLLVLCGMFSASSENSLKEDGTSPTSAQKTCHKPVQAFRRIARLLNICESCKKPLPKLSENDKAQEAHTPRKCTHCGLTVKEEEPSVERRTSKRSTRAREKEQQPDQAPVPNGQFNADPDTIVTPRKVLTWENFPLPEEYLVTRWDDDVYSFGSYSCMPRGSNWHIIDQIAAPEPKDSICPYLFFAGEHCSDVGWQCVHGAHETGIRAAREIISCLEGQIMEPQAAAQPTDQSTGETIPQPSAQKVEPLTLQPSIQPVTQTTHVSTPSPSIQPMSRESFWTKERDRALTRALIGYSDVYGNMSDVIDEIAHAIHSFKKEPTEQSREELRDLVYQRILERSEVSDVEATAFLKFHSDLSKNAEESNLSKPFHEVHKKPRLVGLNGSKLRELYAKDIKQELKSYAQAVHENRISYRETLRKIALKIYERDGGLMTKRCLSEYLRTQEFGTGPQKELFLEKYLPNK